MSIGWRSIPAVDTMVTCASDRRIASDLRWLTEIGVS
jgi:hypothetical protein